MCYTATGNGFTIHTASLLTFWWTITFKEFLIHLFKRQSIREGEKGGEEEKDEEGEGNKRRRKRNIFHLQKNPQYPGLVQAEARNQKPHLGMPHEKQGPKYTGHHPPPFPSALTGSWIRNRTATTQTGALIWCWYSNQRPNPLCHNSQPLVNHSWNASLKTQVKLHCAYCVCDSVVSLKWEHMQGFMVTLDFN